MVSAPTKKPWVDDGRLAKGRQRKREIAAQNRRELLELESQLVASLGHVPSAIESIAIETLAATLVRSRRLQEQGRPDTMERRLITRLLREIGVKGSALAAPRPTSLRESLIAHGITPMGDAPAERAPEQPDAETLTSARRNVAVTA